MKKRISILMAVSLMFLSILPFFNQTYALDIYQTVTKYHLDMGVIHIWGTGTTSSSAIWQDDLEYGEKYDFETSLTFPDKITKVVDAYVLDEDEFDWTDTTGVYTFNEVEDYLTGENSYGEHYKPYMSNSITSIDAVLDGNYTVELSYKAKLKAYKTDYDLAYQLTMGNFEDIINLLGGEDAIDADLYAKLEAGKNGVGSGVYGYMFFVPIVIEYQTIEKVTFEIGQFEAHLDAPDTAHVGETFNVTDQSVFGTESEFAETQLTYCVDNGSTKTASGWVGDTLGEKIEQSFDEACTVKYTITTWNIYGDSDTDSKTVVISDETEPEIEVEPDLILPEYTYEGHSEVAKDESAFTLDGEAYSATRAYAEGIASNTFKADDSSISISKLTDTKAECTFSKKGTYDITLTVKPDGGGRASDTESITVRKTPYIMESLSGFQKQNRKQILTATVATYPGKPLTDYSVTLKDKVTGNSVTLTPDNLQENNTTIKTRSMTVSQDEEHGFAYIKVEFLTKTPSYFSTGDASQQFYYEINVEDSKGDTDTATKYFDVSPDLPPAAAINMDTAFLRNEGTNIATIKAEDATVAADGDGAERTWYYGATTAPSIYTDVSTMSGYSKLSFGTDKIVGFDRTGVGPLTVKLSIKEAWTEPTIEEYVSDSDYLTGTALAYTEVQNVAPVVSLDLLSSTAQKILLLANSDSEYQTLLNGKTALQQELLKNQIDGQIIIKKLLGDSPSSVSGITKELSLTYPCAVWVSGTAEESDYSVMTADSEKSYLATWTISGKSLIAPVTVHAFNPFSGEVWAYTTTNNERFVLGNDDVSKYLYLIYADSSQTVILDKKTGALAGTIDVALSEKVWLTDSLMLWLDDDTLYALDQDTLEKITIDSGVSAAGRVDGNLQYITKTSNVIVRNTLDLATLETTQETVLKIAYGAGSVNYYTPLCIDSNGKVVLFKEPGDGSDQSYGTLAYNVENELVSKVACPMYSGNYTVALDENGACNYILAWSRSSYTYTVYAINLNAKSYAYSSVVACSPYGPTAAFQSGGTGYFYIPGYYTKAGTDYMGTGRVIIYNGGTSITTATTNYGMVGNYDENVRASDRIVTSLLGNGSTGVMSVKISSFAKSLAQETAEIIAKFADKFTFVGDVNTTSDDIIAAAETPKPAMKITATQNGYLYLYNQSLEQNKKYYYEYDLKPLKDGTESSLSGIKASTTTSTSGQSFLSDTLYVTDSYTEDFNSGTVNSFFTVEDSGRFVNGEYGAYYNGSKDNDGYAKLTFTVPTGKQAILTTDYSLYFYNSLTVSNNAATIYDGTNIFIDGATIRDAENYNTGYIKINETGAMFYKLLDAGTHTIECKISASSWYWALIDNLKVDIVSTSSKSFASTYSISASDDDDDWHNVSGAFNTLPSTYSYGAQASTTYYGGLPAVYTYTTKGYVGYITYTQTVPAGYIQNGRVHFGSDPYRKYSYNEFTLNGGSDLRYDWDNYVAVDTWVPLGAKTEGSYTHAIDLGHGDTVQAWMNIFDIVQYPNNAVTSTGNMAFNSTNTKYFFPKTSSTGLTDLSIYLPKGEYLLKNFKIFYIEDGSKIYLQNEDCQEVSDLSKWTLSTGLTKTLYTETEEEEDEDDDYVKIYKKGEKVIYNIFYSDYEDDASKIGYWRYEHTNWPPDTVHPSAGAILTDPIERFYLSGKYTVTHWEVDNTQRPGTVGDATPYDKESNQVTLTFYVDGDGAAPWVTYIRTDPAAVKENNSYMIRVGVDDEEKDTLSLTTEVYLNGAELLSDTKTGIEADEAGNYPEQVISGLPEAETGIYQVVCTVSDYCGTGIKSYRYTVVSDGSIAGNVSHTDQWEVNRKKYNLKRFGEEMNRESVFNDYMALPAPRKRGTNVFWSGERFLLRAETGGQPLRVSVRICTADASGNLTATGYSAELTDTGKLTGTGADIWEGSLWDSGMINQWGRNIPFELTFLFTADYAGGTTREDTATVIIDNERDYWQLHRLW